MNIIKHILLLLALAGSLSYCTDDDSSTDYGPFQVVNNTTILMDGEIDGSTLKDFNRLIENHPDIETINIQEAPGSSDDEVNLKVALKVHEMGIATHLLDDGLIASGGVDFFLAGVRRTKGTNTKIGVHSWADGDNKEATDYPAGHEEHQLYINYYKSVGFSQKEAEDFYYFTINSAPAADIHWMTDEEIERYGILKD